MNLAIELPDEIAQLIRNLPNQSDFLVEAIQRELQRREALEALIELSKKVSKRNEGITDQQLEELLRD